MIRRVSPTGGTTDRAGWGFLALVAAAYLLPQETAGEWAVKSRLVAGALIALGGIAVLRGGASRTLAWTWLALGGWTALSVLWSLDALRSAAQALAITGAAGIVLFRWPRISARAAAGATLGLAVVDALVAFIQRAALPPGTVARVGGSFVSANHHAALVCAGAGVAAAWVVTSRGRTRWLAAAALMLLAGDVLTGGSRAGLVALIVMVALLDRWRPRGFRWAGWVLTFAAFAFAFASPNGAIHRIRVQLHGGEPGSFARAAIWESSLAMLRDAPLAGVGPGSFGEAWPTYRPRAFALFATDYAHGDLAQVAAELGLVGLGLAIWAFACWWRLASRVGMADPDRYAAGSALSVFAVFALVDFPLHVPVLAVVATGLAVSLALPGRPACRQLLPRWPVVATGLVLALWLACGASADLAYLDGATRVAGGDLEGARRRFDLALAAEPAHALSLEALAELDVTGPLTPGRLAEIRRLRPAWVAPLSTAFDRAIMAGDSAGARAARESVIAVDPKGLPGELMDVALAMQAGSMELAARRIAEIATRWPGSFDAALLRADVEIARGRRGSARNVLREMAARFPGSAAVRDRLGRLGS